MLTVETRNVSGRVTAVGLACLPCRMWPRAAGGTAGVVRPCVAQPISRTRTLSAS